MTRQEFLDDVTSWYGLREFCYEIGCTECDDIYDRDEMYENIESDLRDAVDDYSWIEIRDSLDSIDTGYDYYQRSGCLDFCGLDEDDFLEYKEAVEEWACDNDSWTDEDEVLDDYVDEDLFDSDDMREDDGTDDTDTDYGYDEDFTVGELISMCSSVLIGIQMEVEKKQKESEDAFRQYFNVNTPKAIR